MMSVDNYLLRIWKVTVVTSFNMLLQDLLLGKTEKSQKLRVSYMPYILRHMHSVRWVCVIASKFCSLDHFDIKVSYENGPDSQSFRRYGYLKCSLQFSIEFGKIVEFSLINARSVFCQLGCISWLVNQEQRRHKRVLQRRKFVQVVHLWGTVTVVANSVNYHRIFIGHETTQTNSAWRS